MRKLLLAAIAVAASGCTTFVERPRYVAPLPEPPDIDCRGFAQSTLPRWDDPQPYDTPPEPITKVSPVYPDLAREAGVDGTVMTRALVCVNGTVADVHIVKSIPMLDAAAVAAVRRWRYQPAIRVGRPVAIWVDAPVRFSLH